MKEVDARIHCGVEVRTVYDTINKYITLYVGGRRQLVTGIMPDKEAHIERIHHHGNCMAKDVKQEAFQ